METYIVQEGQNLVDVAVQLYGKAEMVVQLCVDNDLTIDQSILGQDTLLYSPIVTDENVTFYKVQGMNVLTGIGYAEDEDGNLLEHSESEHTFSEHN